MKPVLRSFAFLTFSLLTLASAPSFAQMPGGGGVGPNYETRLSGLEDQIRMLNGQLEQIGYSVKRLDQALQRMQADYDARLAKLETDQAATAQIAAQAAAQAQAAATPPAPTPTVTPMPSADAPVPDVKGSLGAVKMQNGKVTGAVNNPKAPPLPDTPADYGLTTQEQYERAFDILRKADYPSAEQAFKTFIDKNPKDKLIDNAKYWYGESLYVQNKYSEAAIAFVDAYQQNPKSAKAPDSLLKLALSLSSLNKTADACTTLSELKTKYPNASASVKSRAGEERTKLKCSAQP